MELEQNEFERLALEIIDSAEKSGILLRLLGAVAFRIHCPAHKDLQVSMNRILTDLDFAAYYKQEKAIDKFFLQEYGVRIADRVSDAWPYDGPEDLR